MNIPVVPLTIKTSADRNIAPGSVVVRGAAVGIMVGPADQSNGDRYLLWNEDGVVLAGIEDRPSRTIAIGAPSDVRLVLGTPVAPAKRDHESMVGLLGVDNDGCFIVADKRVATADPDEKNPAVISLDGWREQGASRLERANCWFKEWSLVTCDPQGHTTTVIHA